MQGLGVSQHLISEAHDYVESELGREQDLTALLEISLATRQEASRQKHTWPERRS